MLLSTLREEVPWGADLPAADFAARHRLVRVVLAGHLPVFLALALIVGEAAPRALADLAPLAALLGLASARLPARARALAASLGLIGCSALGVHLSSGLLDAYFHYFSLVAVTLVAVYEDALIYLVAVVFVLVEHGVVGVIDPDGLFTGAGDPWPWAVVHAIAIVAQSAALLVFWRYGGRPGVGRAASAPSCTPAKTACCPDRSNWRGCAPTWSAPSATSSAPR